MEATPTSQASAGKKPTEYETIYVLRPDASPEDAEKVAARVCEVLEKASSLLVLVETWGRRKLAYPIRKCTRGTFIYLRYVGGGNLVAELERNLRLLDPVLRYQTVCVKKGVDLNSYQVDPELVKFAPVEAPPSDEEEESLEARLGLVSHARPSSRSDHEAEEGAEDDSMEAEGAAPTEGVSPSPEPEVEEASSDPEVGEESTSSEGEAS